MTRLTARDVQSNLEIHVESPERHITRREVNKRVLVNAAKVVVGWEIIKGSLGWAWKKFQGFEPEFDVYIYSPEKIAELSEEERKLIAGSHNHLNTSDGYMRVDFSCANNDHIEVDIFTNDYMGHCIGRNLGINNARPLMERYSWGEKEFLYIVQGPGFGSGSKFYVKPNFLDDEGLLAKIVEAEALDRKSQDKCDEKFSEFSLYANSLVDWHRGYNDHGVPEDCEIRIKKEPVTYHIRGLHTLTPDKDMALFGEYWKRRADFEDYASWRQEYTGMQEAGDRVEAVHTAKSDPNI